jgi:magnesium transporter
MNPPPLSARNLGDFAQNVPAIPRLPRFTGACPAKAPGLIRHTWAIGQHQGGLNSLLRRDLHVVDEAMTPYYQDVYDHVLRVTEWTESLRDLVATTVETNLTIQANHMNLIMKKVTSWAAIIAVPTAITGFYGQNLPFPGAGTHWGVLSSTALIGVLSVILYVAFKRKDWL